MLLDFFARTLARDPHQKVLIHSIKGMGATAMLVTLLDINMALLACYVILLSFYDTQGNLLPKPQTHFTKDSMRTMLYYVCSFYPEVSFFLLNMQMQPFRLFPVLTFPGPHPTCDDERAEPIFHVSRVRLAHRTTVLEESRTERDKKLTFIYNLEKYK